MSPRRRQNVDVQLGKHNRLEKERCIHLEISVPGMVVFNAEPGGGKSHAIRSLAYQERKNIKHCIAFSRSAFRKVNLEYIPNYEGTEKQEKDYFNFKHKRFNEARLRAFLDFQESFKEGHRPLGCIIIDDDISDPKMYQSEAIIDAVTMFRHYNLIIFLSTQYINKFPTVVRECASQVAIFKLNSFRSIRAAYESYAQQFETYNQFRFWLDKVTDPIEEHKLAWKDRRNGKPWQVLRFPKKIPKFRLNYGLRDNPLHPSLWNAGDKIFEKGKAPKSAKKGGSKKRKRAPVPKSAFTQSFDNAIGFARKRYKHNDFPDGPYEDSVMRERLRVPEFDR